MKNSYLMENCFRNNMLNADTAPLIRLLRRHLTTVAAKRFPGTIRARQSCRILERGSLLPPLAALRLFPPGEGLGLV